MRIVLDTNILARANPYASGSAKALLEHIRDSEDHVLVLSPFLLTELERVLNYPRLQALWPTTRDEIVAYIQALQDFGETVFPVEVRSVVAGDADDDPILAAAVSGRANVLCTMDRHLRTPEVLDYAKTHRVDIMSDAELLRLLRTGVKHVH